MDAKEVESFSQIYRAPSQINLAIPCQIFRAPQQRMKNLTRSNSLFMKL